MKVKICGVCRAVDAAAVAAAGADFIGVILAPGSRRTLGLDAAREVLAAAPKVRKVGVFVDASVAAIVHAVSYLGLNVVQLHGAESPQDVTALRAHASVWKAVRVREPSDVERAAERYSGVDALLLDAWHPGQAGGTGTAFDWAAISARRDSLPAGLRIVLAGGLTPENVSAAVRTLRPYVVDVSSGVEVAAGVKSPERIQAFVAAARAAPASPIES